MTPRAVLLVVVTGVVLATGAVLVREPQAAHPHAAGASAPACPDATAVPAQRTVVARRREPPGPAPTARAERARSDTIGSEAPPAPGATLRGHVRAASGRPVAGAVLRRLDATGRTPMLPDGSRGQAVAMTDSEGAFVVSGLERGPWKLLITSPDHPDRIESGAIPGDHGVPSRLDVVLEDGAEIHGSVTPSAQDRLWIRAVAEPAARDPASAVAPGEAEAAGVPRLARCEADGSFTVRGLQRDARYRLAAADAMALHVLPCTPWVAARAGDAAVVLERRLRAAIVFEVRDGRTSAPLTDLEVCAGHRCLLPVRDASGRIRRAFPAGRVRIDDLNSPSAGESLAVVVRAPGHREKQIAGLHPIDGQTLDLGVVYLWQ